MPQQVKYYDKVRVERCCPGFIRIEVTTGKRIEAGIFPLSVAIAMFEGLRSAINDHPGGAEILPFEGREAKRR